jgi:hypothetical protein
MLMADAKAETGNVKFSDTRTRAAAPGVSSRKTLADPPGPDNAAVDIVPLLTLLTAGGHRIASDGGGRGARNCRKQAHWQQAAR